MGVRDDMGDFSILSPPLLPGPSHSGTVQSTSPEEARKPAGPPIHPGCCRAQFLATIAWRCLLHGLVISPACPDSLLRPGSGTLDLELFFLPVLCHDDNSGHLRFWGSCPQPSLERDKEILYMCVIYFFICSHFIAFKLKKN